MKTPHVHAALIKQWADGAMIQYKDNENWYDVTSICGPVWAPNEQYRVKPEPKHDIVLYAYINLLNYDTASIQPVTADTRKLKADTCMFVFDGETGKLKDAQILAKE